MSKRKVAEKVEIREGSRNVYHDLGFPDAEEMLVKAQLVSKIGEIIRSKGLTQVQAARILGLPQPKLSGVLRGQFRGVSERKLIECLTRLGRDVEIVVKDAPRRRAGGKLTVVFG
jgi:predicted XRE-type DNA-binding protein